jgi:hypothetical protein
LKAAKKQQKEMDEDDLAFREKQKAGMDSAYTLHIFSSSQYADKSHQMPRLAPKWPRRLLGRDLSLAAASRRAARNKQLE